MAPFNMSSLARLALLVSSLTAGTYGHLIMNSPVPFGLDTLNNSPLVDAKPGAQGSDYPCKQRPGVYDITAMNNMKVGDTQLLNFTGSVSHGGGTCQIAVTMDAQPDIKSVWKVIQVFEGGCPINADGNDGTHPFTFEIPKGFPNGPAVLSWTWYNRIGNREIYQNCAPITVTGGADDHTLFNSLPNLYIINLPTSECSSVGEAAQPIPFPGQYVLTNTAVSNTLVAATGPSCAASAAAQTSGVTGYKTAIVQNAAAYSAPAKNGDVTGPAQSGASATGAPSAPVGDAASSPAAAITTAPAQASNAISVAPAGSSATDTAGAAPTQTAAASSTAGTGSTPVQASGSSFPTATVASSAGISGPATGTASAPAPVATGSVAGGSGSTTGSTTGSSTGGTGTCSGDGTLVCNGPNQFGLCNNGAVVWQAVADGTTCSNGQITRRSYLRDTRSRRRVQNAQREMEELAVAAHTFD